MTHIHCPPPSWFSLNPLLFSLAAVLWRGRVKGVSPVALVPQEFSQGCCIFSCARRGWFLQRSLLPHALQWAPQNSSFGCHPAKEGFPCWWSLLPSERGGRVQPSRVKSSPFDLLKVEGSCNGILSQADASGLLSVRQSLSQELDKHPGEKQITC